MTDPQVHVEPFVHLVDVTPTRALVAWGAFWFRRPTDGDVWHVVEDEDLHRYTDGRRASIGSGAEPYGDARVQALDASGRVVARVPDGRAHLGVARRAGAGHGVPVPRRRRRPGVGRR